MTEVAVRVLRNTNGGEDGHTDDWSIPLRVVFDGMSPCMLQTYM